MHQTDLRRIDLNLLVVFDAIAQTRSVTLTAERLALSQPAISHALKRLRQLLGDPLFVRGRDGLVLTPRAQDLNPVVAQTLATLGTVFATPHFDPISTQRSFRIAASDYSMITVLPHVIRQLRQRAPRATVEIRHGGPEALSAMESGGLDLAFWGAEPPGGAFSAQEHFRESYVGLICADHPLAALARQGRLTVEDFTAHPHVVATQRDARTSPIERALMALGHRRQVGMTSPNFLANIASLPGTDLIMAAPSRLAHATPTPGLVSFILPFAVPDYAYSIVWHQRATADAAHQWLRTLLVAAVSEATGEP